MALHGSVVDVAAQTIRSVWSGVSSLPSAGLNFQFSKNGGTLFAVGAFALIASEFSVDSCDRPVCVMLAFVQSTISRLYVLTS